MTIFISKEYFMFKIIFTVVFAIIFAGCVGTTSPIGKGVITKPQHNTAKTVQK